MIGARPQTGVQGTVRINTFPLMVQLGTYVETEAERFGEKISIGETSYMDFNPYENADSASRFNGGYGLQKYTDMDDSKAAHHWLKEAADFDGANGYGLMSGLKTTEALTGASDTPILLSEMTTIDTTRRFIAVAGTGIFQRAAAGTWAVVAAGNPLPAAATCAGIFGNILMIGYGAARTAQWTDDLVTLRDLKLGTTPAYAFSFTSDKASAYMAGGTALGPYQGNTVFSSLDGKIFLTLGTSVCPPGQVVTGLAPGGGVAIIFYAWPSGVGMITTSGTAQTLVSFDWPDSQNGSGLGWVMGNPEDPQRGSLVLHFRRDNDPYIFQPGASGESGSAVNIAPWADPAIRPTSGVGVPTAWFGTARWLYYALRNPVDGTVRIVRRDLRSGATSHYWDLGATTCTAIGMTSIFGSQPILLVGSGTNVVTTPLQRSGGSPLTDTACRYEDSAQFDLPDMDMGFPDEPKIEFSVRVEADNLTPSTRSIVIQYASDGDTVFTPLGTADESPVTEILFEPPPSDRRICLRGVCTNGDPTQTMIVNGITLRRSINPALYRVWEFDAFIPAGQGMQGDDLQIPKTLRNALWAARIAGIPVPFVDIQGDTYGARIMHLEFKNVAIALGSPPQEVVHVRLMQVASSIGTTSTLAFTIETSGAAWPLPILLPTVGLAGGDLSSTVTITNSLDHTVYPTWTLSGPVGYVSVQNVGEGYTWAWAGTVGQNDGWVANFNPTKKIVTGTDGTDRGSDVVPASVYWGLVPGPNTVTVTLAGGATGTSLQISWPSG